MIIDEIALLMEIKRGICPEHKSAYRIHYEIKTTPSSNSSLLPAHSS